MKTIEKIASGIALVAGLSLATYGFTAKENTIKKETISLIYGTAGMLVGIPVGVYLTNYLDKIKK